MAGMQTEQTARRRTVRQRIIRLHLSECEEKKSYNYLNCASKNEGTRDHRSYEHSRVCYEPGKLTSSQLACYLSWKSTGAGIAEVMGSTDFFQALFSLLLK